MNFWNFLVDSIEVFSIRTGFASVTTGHMVMILVGVLFILLGIRFGFEPLFLIPIGFGMLIDNIPFKDAGLQISIYEEEPVLNILYQGMRQGWHPPLIFLGIGAMTDSSALISNPKLMLIGATAQFGIFGACIIALQLGSEPNATGVIGIIGGTDGSMAIFLSFKLVPDLLDAVAISACPYMALIPIIRPPFMRLLTTNKERRIRIKAPRKVSRIERTFFPIFGLLLTGFLVPSGLPLLGMLFFGNILKESGVCGRLTRTAHEPLIDMITVLLGVIAGVSTRAACFPTLDSVKIFILGALPFIIATCSGVLFIKVVNLLLKEGNRINPLIGNAGVSAVPDSAHILQIEGVRYDRANYPLMHAMGPNVASIIGSAVTAGVPLGFLSQGSTGSSAIGA